MKKVLFALAVCSLIMGNVQSAERIGKPSKDVLAKMGLSGMTIVSDEMGTAIRGKGFKSPALKFPGNKYTGYRTGQNLKPGYGGLK
jgi:hypothetical protein